MKKFSVSFEIDYTYKELFLSASVEFLSKETMTFWLGKLCLPLSVSFVASRLSRIEKYFGEREFKMCKLKIDEAYEEYLNKNKHD